MIGKSILTIFSFLILALFSNFGNSAAQNCKIPFEKGQLPEHPPFLAQNKDMIYPDVENGKRVVNIKNSENITVGCSGKDNTFSKGDLQQMFVQCKKGELFNSNGKTTIAELECKNEVEEILTTLSNGTLCMKNHVQLSIKFQATSEQNDLISICHDPSIDNTLLVKHEINGEKIEGAIVSNDRPAFKVGPFYKTFSVNNAYERKTQKTVVSEIVKDSKLGDEYIQSNTEIYLARGHMTPDGDMIELYEQDATYYYANAFPQWQSVNNGNWKRLEFKLREEARKTKNKFVIYTGTHGVIKLADSKGAMKEIYLAKDKEGKQRLPVPNLSWKAIHIPKSKKAIAIFMVNNPHQAEKDISQFVLCKDICKDIPWVDWTKNDIKSGYTFCCEINKALVSKIGYMPPIYGQTILTNFQ